MVCWKEDTMCCLMSCLKFQNSNCNLNYRRSKSTVQISNSKNRKAWLQTSQNPTYTWLQGVGSLIHQVLTVYCHNLKVHGTRITQHPPSTYVCAPTTACLSHVVRNSLCLGGHCTPSSHANHACFMWGVTPTHPCSVTTLTWLVQVTYTSMITCINCLACMHNSWSVPSMLYASLACGWPPHPPK